ncbi:MAG: hypothetical protein IPK97_17790, partial [Ahniella sp.]|nr:hypothetical protein [Ahniella sp.]
MTERHGAGQVLLDGLGPLSTLPWRAQMQVMLRLMERVALTMSEDLAVIPRAQQVRWFQRRQERLGLLGQTSETD